MKQRLKTVELIVEKTDWIPPPAKYSLDTLVPLHIEVHEKDLRAMLKAAGGALESGEATLVCSVR
ncbi:MAG: hypothetical protein PHN84_07920 [Desulfuromonadaceae bacterium]|nr:hypothetical protein [Desulfuromonadaceae bacterium]MDD2854759.1 hypothetical protein [Desulfuromonadaceae bacterium]